MPSETAEKLQSIRTQTNLQTLIHALVLIVLADIGYFVSDGNEHFFLFATVGIIGGIIAVSAVISVIRRF
ncbi:hypothetical protein C5C07_17155 [Haloferax sp. Atlit-4N]|uniref:hypothetical protein n=1 Tax=Haloferax sp. Atlit-4N TaxID=2077206 RepID=UPI000E27CEA8|nr:hypothetical protein [Haloferax sp. Atlit-4N]RDZ51323.1 hypothetical protein C5C07_17155 [Haloferax sp. Atlit-4N]